MFQCCYSPWCVVEVEELRVNPCVQAQNASEESFGVPCNNKQLKDKRQQKGRIEAAPSTEEERPNIVDRWPVAISIGQDKPGQHEEERKLHTTPLGEAIPIGIVCLIEVVICDNMKCC